eukprot:scaffold22804_cov74-Phaeocystis_antarctica.AAC.7
MHFAPAPRGLLLQQRTAARVASPSRHPSRLELNAGRAARARGHPRAVLYHVCVREERVSDSILHGVLVPRRQRGWHRGAEVCVGGPT